MHENHRKASELLKNVIEELTKIHSQDGEDISYYTACSMNDPIRKLIDVKTLMACADVFDPISDTNKTQQFYDDNIYITDDDNWLFDGND